MNILKHPIYKAICDLCRELEKLPASVQQTKIVVMASNLEQPADQLYDELQDALSRLDPAVLARTKSVRTAEGRRYKKR